MYEYGVIDLMRFREHEPMGEEPTVLGAMLMCSAHESEWSDAALDFWPEGNEIVARTPDATCMWYVRRVD